ncbi:twin-arginine translocation signal domain-containing protein [Shewanella sp. JNE10-2]|uniref:twin-arginine translocation signal domain-containing protein n=1 Tax=unclassified Shewanella TaxID=196818 RepID=UPI002005B349|nr:MULTISPECIES: twin-arginine translocation signal domain-containing protein [unclassified Shewanella]MCK7630979.1 twin-arginine translocation signal domain-containing protein [Shewanella sp. JNE9-1]MCK7633935.1 twin-arginine translocation signal domain-containing protein [Shewanella sp. JNE17]MCK7646232.1 twin-arginine translocation signal domain-containing protein [Shewanella sp. JNE3-1]MCK7649160.1 twin-arginine translocation signal domain-containing protein [Shewanella sp. JNE8]MCK7654187
MKKQASDMGRRQLLKALALGSAAGAVATVSGQALAAAPTVEPIEPKSDNYRETDHIRHYYASLKN